MTSKLGRMVTYLDGLLPIKSGDPLIAWPCETMRLAKTIVSSQSMSTKLGRIVTYLQDLINIMLIYPLVT